MIVFLFFLGEYRGWWRGEAKLVRLSSLQTKAPKNCELLASYPIPCYCGNSERVIWILHVGWERIKLDLDYIRKSLTIAALHIMYTTVQVWLISRGREFNRENLIEGTLSLLKKANKNSPEQVTVVSHSLLL